MHYSVFSRFQGALLGAALGHLAGATPPAQPTTPSLAGTSTPPAGFSVSSSSPPPTEGTAAIATLKALIQRQGCPIPWSEHGACLESPITLTTLVLSLLPTALYYHDHRSLGRSQIQQVLTTWPQFAEEVDALRLLFDLTALFLRNSTPPVDLGLVFNSVSIGDAIAPSLRLLLVDVHQCLQESASLAIAHHRLHSLNPQPDHLGRAIAFSLYCVLSTPHAPHLAIVRASQPGHSPSHSPSLTGLLAGFLTGSLTGLASWPEAWRHPLQTATPSPLLRAWGLDSEAELLRLAEQLSATWMGALDPDHLLNQHQHEAMAIAAPLARQSL